jgi:hypothetical protein
MLGRVKTRLSCQQRFMHSNQTLIHADTQQLNSHANIGRSSPSKPAG